MSSLNNEAILGKSPWVGNTERGELRMTNRCRFWREGYVSGIVTQNVDRLHHRAGSKNVVELHGRNDVVRCLSCHAI